ncbi:hypothetical protein [Undibacterium sp. Di24W]|uniref:hypothetical protein n=1 Tax=Undibacterium sp. Di24W TaxID=3413033 RepID=UPI003BF2FA28
MNQSTTTRHWLIATCAIAILIALGYMGEDSYNDQALSASVVDEIKNSEQAAMLNHKREMAAIDARARKMTGYDNIKLAEARR